MLGVTFWSKTILNIGANLSLVRDYEGLLRLHSKTPLRIPSFIGLKADTSAGCRIRVELGYKEINITYL